LNGAKGASIGVGEDAPGVLEETISLECFYCEASLGCVEIRGAERNLDLSLPEDLAQFLRYELSEANRSLGDGRAVRNPS
jgi:hypothetical protein